VGALCRFDSRAAHGGTALQFNERDSGSQYEYPSPNHWRSWSKVLRV